MHITRAFLMLLAGIIFFSACKKPVLEDTVLIPKDSLALQFTDTFSVQAYTVREDSVNVTNSNLAPLGILNDQHFGKTEASFYIPFSLPASNLNLGTNPQLDSVVLYFAFEGTYGDVAQPMSIEAYEMTENISEATTVSYYSNATFDISSTPAASVSGLVANTSDSVTIYGVKYRPMLRLPLDSTFGNKLVNASGTSDFTNTASFRQFFKGLYLKATGGNGLLTLNPAAPSGIFLYYHNADTSIQLIQRFAAESALIINHYEHDYHNSTAASYISTAQKNDSLIFIQGLSGLTSRFHVPFLKNIGNIVINRAELVLTQATGFDEAKYSSPTQMTMLIANEDGTFGSIIPDMVISTGLFGGEKIDSPFVQYKFTLSRYYQQVINNDREDNGIFILPNNRHQLPYRLVAGGGNHSQFRLKLNLTYTIVEL